MSACVTQDEKVRERMTVGRVKRSAASFATLCL